MNLPHLHLLLNHFPTVGFIVGLGLFLVGVVGKSEDLKRAALAVFVMISLLTIPVYVSGSAAQFAIQDSPDVSVPSIAAHRDTALLALVLMELTGLFAWVGLWQYFRASGLTRASLIAVLVFAFLTVAVTAQAANIGGEIRHPEIQSPQEAAAAEGTGGSDIARSIGSFVTAHPWVWPTCETLHFIGLCLLFTVVLIVDLRLLGMAKKVSFAALYQLLPLGILGFGLNLLTGMMFFMATPEQYVKNVAFQWKMILVFLAGINALYFILFDEAWTVGPGDDAPLTAKVVAGSAIFLWLGVLFFGHMLPFIGNAF